MTPTPTPTSGAADLPEALINIAREIEALKRDCGMDTESAIAVQNGRYMAISYKVRALAAGQATAAPAQPAAQQGAAYAALPEKYYLAGGEVLTWDAKQMHAFADATHTLRASHGQAPAETGNSVSAQTDSAPSRFGSPELQAMIIARCVEKDQADSVQEDAARYRWLRRWKGQEHEPPFTVQHEIDGTLWGGDLDAAIDTARKQGANHD